MVTLEDVGSGTGHLVLEPELGSPAGQITFEPGEVLFSKLRPYLAKSWLVDRPAHGSNEFLALRPAPTLEARYLLYVTLSEPWLDWAVQTSYGTKMPRTSWAMMADFELPEISLEEQRRIADFLDDQTTRIDNIITARQEQIALLDELTQGTLRGLYGVDPTPEFLLGLSAGKHTTLRRLGVSAISGGTPDSANSAYWTDAGEGTSWISITDLVEGGTVSATQKDLTPAGLAAARLAPVNSPTVLFAMYASLGKTSVSCVPAVWNQAILGLAPGVSVDPGYLLGWFELIKAVLPALARASTQNNLNAEQVMSLRIPVRDLRSQQMVALERRRSQERAASISALLTQAITRLQELKRSLVSAAVSGEFDVASADGSGVRV